MSFFQDSFMAVLMWLLVAHVIGDYILQNDFIAKAKNHMTDVGRDMYLAVLPAHGMIHAGLVMLVTGSVVLGLIEFIVHTFTDWLKCDERITFYTDQIVHVVTKVVIALLFWAF